MPTKNRNRGIVRLDDEFLCRALNLPEGQQVIGFRISPETLSIDICVEGAGLPEVAPGCEAPLVNTTQYASPWMLRGTELELKVRALVKRWSDDGDEALDSAAACLVRVLDEGRDPR